MDCIQLRVSPLPDTSFSLCLSNSYFLEALSVFGASYLFQALRASVDHLVTKAMKAILDFYDKMLSCNNVSLVTYSHVKSTSTAGSLKMLFHFFFIFFI